MKKRFGKARVALNAALALLVTLSMGLMGCDTGAKDVPVTGVTLDQVTLSLEAGSEATLVATVEPADATNQKVTWTTSDEKIVTVENGVVKAVADGTAVVTVTTEDGNKTSVCTVNVTPKTVVVENEDGTITTTVTKADGSVIATTTDAEGNKISTTEVTTDAEGNTIKTITDAEGSVRTEKTDAEGVVSIVVKDKDGNETVIKTVVVKFDADNGEEIPAQNLETGKLVTKPATDPVKEGFVFKGWFNGDDAYDFATPVADTDITLKAKWVALYKVTFDLDGADKTCKADPQTVEAGAKATKPADPTKAGNTFAGWFAGDKAYDFNAAVTANVTLKAKWTLNKYKVTFDTDGGSKVAAVDVDYNAKATAPAAPTKVGRSQKKTILM